MYHFRLRLSLQRIAISLAIMLFTWTAARADSLSVASPSDHFGNWLGPQSFVEQSSTLVQSEGDLKTALSVMKGVDIDLPKEIQEITTSKNGKIVAVSRSAFDADKFYIVGIVTANSSTGNVNVADGLIVRVVQGQFSGAVVHLRPGKRSRLPSRQFAAIYEIPEQLDVRPSVLKFNVIHQRVREFSEKQCQVATSRWLGPQNKRAAIPRKAVEKSLPGIAIETAVVAGKDLTFPESQNRIVTSSEGRIVEVADFVPDNLRQYLVVNVFATDGGGIGRAVYDLDVVVTGGELDGAVVHCRSGTLPESISDPLVAVFEVPMELVLAESIVSTEVVYYRIK